MLVGQIQVDICLLLWRISESTLVFSHHHDIEDKQQDDNERISQTEANDA